MGVLDEPVTLIASPSYPNSIAWSKDNLIAIATGHIITILNPASPVRPRGMITLPSSNPFPIGVVKHEDLFTPCLLPLTLACDVRPCVRSISWSPPGFAPNAGCLLAVCTTEGRVKIYRPPFCEYRVEWVEVVDISDMLYHCLSSINFGEMENPSKTLNQGQVNACSTSENGSGLGDSITNSLPKYRKSRVSSMRIQEKKDAEIARQELQIGGDVDHTNRNTCKENHNPRPRKIRKLAMNPSAALNPCTTLEQVSSAEKSTRQRSDGTKNNAGQLITPQRYASRIALLSSQVIAWSPILKSSGVDNLNVRSNCSILASGGKSGNISFWRIHEPQCYTIEHSGVPVEPVIVGLLQAHNSWITAISWGIHGSSSLESKVVLATASCDGSVKIWFGDARELIQSSEADNASLTLLREVTAVTYVPVSTISLVVPSLDKVVLAIGRGSGSLEVWFCQMSSNELESAGVYNAHDQVVTGLAWASVGGCLYSCSQENSVRSWVLRGSSLYEIPLPLNFPELKKSIDLSQVLDLCFGLALSPGELMVAVVCSFDSHLLNPMYQARIQKAAVEFYWTGGQSLEISSNKYLEGSAGTSFSSCDKDLPLPSCESTILRSLRDYDNGDEPVVLWDILLALLSFRKTEPNLVENILFKWMSSWFVDYQSDDSIEKLLFHVKSVLSKITTRRIQLLNIICRRLIFGESKLDIFHEEIENSSGIEGEERELDLWKELLVNGESEVRKRFVSFTFKAILSHASSQSLAPQIGRSWSPAGAAQMQRWVVTNPLPVHDEPKLLGSKIGELGSRIHSVCEYLEEEHCSYCSALVPFESTEAATCEGTKHKDGSQEKHELKRCAVSMQIGSATSPMWFCMCCRRQVLKLLPLSFFTMSESPVDVNYESLALEEHTAPLCPFCGILLQRLLPDFLLSTSPL